MIGLQPARILARPRAIGLVAVPLVFKACGALVIARAGARALRRPLGLAATAGLIGAARWFEMEMAVAVLPFGMASGAALATVVGVPAEVPVRPSLVAQDNPAKSPAAST